ncbi:MAG: alpha-E domain-containing protein [Opitutia bacterium]
MSPMMLSRVADHLYWMSRQMERAENLARLVRVSEEMLLDDESLGRGSAQEYWTPVLAATAMEGAFRGLYPEPRQGDAARFLTLDLRNPDSILSCIKQARENARSVRDKISDEMWTELNALHMLVTSPEGAQLLARSPHSFYEKIIASSMLFDGITEATLTRDEGWNFLQLGRLLERADMTSRFLDIRSQTPGGDSALESLQWGAVLRACSAHASYRRLHGGEISVERVVDLLLFSNEFPRSVRHCLRRADEVLHDISGTPTGRYSNPCEKITGALLARLSFAGPGEVMARGLHAYIDELQTQLNGAGQAVFETYVLLPGEVNRHFPRPGRTDALSDWHREQQQQQQQQ